MKQIYKLRYKDKETAIADLIAKAVYNEDLSFGKGIHAVVECGLIVLTDGTYSEDGTEITPPIFADGYHYDIMCEKLINFENEINPKNPKHSFAGYERNN